jgi:hypothetical protein
LKASPGYQAVTLWVPAASALVVQVAVRVLPVPARTLAEQPPIDIPPSRKLTVPPGAKPVTLAVKVICAPGVEGLSELVRAVLVFLESTTCVNGELLAAALTASPPY